MKYYIIKLRHMFDEKAEFIEAFTSKKAAMKYVKRVYYKKPIALYVVNEKLMWKDKRYV